MQRRDGKGSPVPFTICSANPTELKSSHKLLNVWYVHHLPTLFCCVLVLFAHILLTKVCTIELNELLFYRSKVNSSFVSEHWNRKEHFKELPLYRKQLDM
jgi:ABC-type uncharacterized transport system fused permease/ATPase subunit